MILPLEHHPTLSPALQVCYLHPAQALVTAPCSLCSCSELSMHSIQSCSFHCPYPSQLPGLQDNVYTPHLASMPPGPSPYGCLQSHRSPVQAWSFRLCSNQTTQEPSMSQLFLTIMPLPMLCFFSFSLAHPSLSPFPYLVSSSVTFTPTTSLGPLHITSVNPSS